MSPEEHEVMRSVEDHYWWYRALRQHVTDSIASKIAEFTLLDAGCGTGGMLRVVRDRFPEAKLMGLDVSAHALQLAFSRELGAEFVQGAVEHLPFATERFDTVLSIDVITHSGVDEKAALREAHRVLRNNGQLIINVAAFDFLKGEHDVAVDVDRRYTSSQLAKLLTNANFAIEKMTYWNALFAPAVAALRWLSRARKTQGIARSDFRPLPAFLNQTLKRIAQLELRVSDHVCLPFGTSLFAVARKNG